MSRIKLAGAVLCLLATSLPAIAAPEAGDWIFRAGFTQVDPKSDNHPAVKVDSATGVTFNGTYMATAHVGIELLAALPFEHDIALVSGENVGSTKQLPPTLSVQWHFSPLGNVTPYVGIGANYTIFFDEETYGALDGTKLSLDPSFGVAGQIGFDADITETFFINFDLRYINIETTAKLDGAVLPGGDIKIDPWTTGINLGWRF